MASTGQSSTPARRGPKPALSRELVIEAALDLVDEEGLAALNVRKLASRLGISAMTPYHYFDDKADLLTAMVGHALAPLAGDLDPKLPWHRQIDDAMRDLHRTLQRHPGVVELIMAESEGLRLNGFRQDLISTLRRAGLTRARSSDVLRSLTSYVFGYTMLNRLRPGSRARAKSVDSFDCGLQLMMKSLREEVEGP
jgi:AcrR family transcriptional regulator